jgi:hypothetical protein
MRLAALVGTKDGAIAGFVRQAGRLQVSFVLRVGESFEGDITLVEADVDAGTAVLRKGDETALFAMGSLAPPPPLTAAPATPLRASYAERRRVRQETLRQAQQPRLSGEVLQQQLREYQMQLIRTGQPALPIPLTPEQDAQLVKEGVLPPAE